MTKKLFWEDPYLTTLETVVESVFGNAIILRETIFYAFSGGQDRITSYNVCYTKLLRRCSVATVAAAVPAATAATAAVAAAASAAATTTVAATTTAAAVATAAATETARALLARARLVDANLTAVELDSVHRLDRRLCVFVRRLV